MTWILEGSCNHCGECCKRSGGFMVHNCMIDENEGECNFYVEKLVDGHCLVYIAASKGAIEEARDKYSNKITSHQIRWFKQNCPPWPGDEMTNRLLSSCGFNFTNV